MSKYRTLQGTVSEEEEKALDMIVSFHEKKLNNPMCYFCETNLATTINYGELSCDQCKIDEYRQIENPVTARKRTDEQNAQRQKMMKMAFDHTFNECWYCEDLPATSVKLGQIICDDCNEVEVRTTLPIHKMTEYEKATQLRIAINLFK